MILLYGLCISVVLTIILLVIESDDISKMGDSSQQVILLLVIVGASIVGSISLSLRIFLRSYFKIEVSDKFIYGPSLFGFAWRKEEIAIAEINSISHNQLLELMGIYIVRSTNGKIICISGFDEDRFNELKEILSTRGKTIG